MRCFVVIELKRGEFKPEYELTRILPERLKSSLPSVEEIEEELMRKLKE